MDTFYANDLIARLMDAAARRVASCYRDIVVPGVLEVYPTATGASNRDKKCDDRRHPSPEDEC